MSPAFVRADPIVHGRRDEQERYDVRKAQSRDLRDRCAGAVASLLGDLTKTLTERQAAHSLGTMMLILGNFFTLWKHARYLRKRCALGMTGFCRNIPSSAGRGARFSAARSNQHLLSFCSGFRIDPWRGKNRNLDQRIYRSCRGLPAFRLGWVVERLRATSDSIRTRRYRGRAKNACQVRRRTKR